MVALVTGGASGLGHATVKRLTKLGSKVVFCDLSTSKGHEIAKESGENVTYVPANVCKEEDVQNVLNEIERLHGRLNVVVNCAGLADAHPTYNFNKSRARELSEFHHILKVIFAVNIITIDFGLFHHFIVEFHILDKCIRTTKRKSISSEASRSK